MDPAFPIIVAELIFLVVKKGLLCIAELTWQIYHKALISHKSPNLDSTTNNYP